MKLSVFILQLAIVTLISVALVIGFNFNPRIASGEVLSWSTVLVFLLFAGLVYFMSSYAARQPNKNFYSSVILLVMMTKMFLCILMVAVYVKLYGPTSNHFLIPFFSIYILYTIFEVHFMTRIGNYDGGKKNDG
jgi:ABC-type transport system involved in cytochrome c biogenesis permease subunit